MVATRQYSEYLDRENNHLDIVNIAFSSSYIFARLLESHKSEIINFLDGKIENSLLSSAIARIERRNLRQFFDQVDLLSFCKRVENFEFYLTSILQRILLERKSIIKSFNDSILYKELLESSSIEEVLDTFVEEKVIELSFKGFHALIDFINKNYKLGIDTATKEFSEISLLFEIRNIIVHNDGIINRKFLRRLEELKLRNLSFVIEQKIDGSEPFMDEAKTLKKYAKDLDGIFIKKFKLDVFADLLDEAGAAASDDISKTFFANYKNRYKPNQICPITSEYTVFDKYGDPTSEKVIVAEGKRFPRAKDNRKYGLRLELPAD